MLEGIKKFGNKFLTKEQPKKFEWKEGVSFSLNKISDTDNSLRLGIYLDQKHVGYADLSYQEKSRTYFLSEMAIHPDDRDKKLGSNLIESVNSFLDSKDIDGFLKNGIDIFNTEDENVDLKVGLYKRHGWKSAGGGFMKRNPN